jgi:hypothetical protein
MYTVYPCVKVKKIWIKFEYFFPRPTYMRDNKNPKLFLFFGNSDQGFEG